MGGSGEITNYLINLDIIEIIQFCLKIYDLWRHLHLWVGVWVVGWMGGWVDGWLGGWVVGWMGGSVGQLGGQVILLNIE